MTLLSIRNEDGSETLGIKTATGIIDVRQAAALTGVDAPLTLDRLLQDGRGPDLGRLIAAFDASDRAKAALRPEAGLHYGRLFRNPGKILCVGLNYRRHAEEVGMAIPKTPILFSKFNNALAPHNAAVELPPRDLSYKIDYEVELVVVIGRAARNVSEADALDHVAGYCTGNDLSARDLQLERGSQWLLGKTLDGFAPIGPYFVSADQIENPNNLRLETRLNGELRQSSNTNDFIFNCQQVISYISRHWTLEAGDIIFTGTPQGVIQGLPADRQAWLKAGDKVVCSVEKLGELAVTMA
ncbi:5-oxopent-3-ene-1,2,5-tricarboxylate decarboxylase [Telmatospirillum siberiense]|uniref:5-oxopent-3-ene-1,2,5-tricarboxylate decarboxylase n=1 Tax=Telmatospirillum siberiense TaxID=382514 RepID=A0A2N3PR92_9PROT|nr:5-oxopent-3-ene-1,2,5-tricarboxylate decarboxylase [Telmatospirillum siberiense]